ncbi:MAG TPA: hypothetical protein VN408_40190 [Actinoplanes sp.]|nr:hypothetical protein [Actinoplanes sp.]
MSLWDRAGNPSVEPDVTSTGMNTFPGSLFESPVAPVQAEARPPRRFVAISAFCALAAGGTAGAYLLATTVLAGRMTDPPPVVSVAAAPPAAPPAEPAAAPPAEPVVEATVRNPREDTGMGPVPQRRHTVRAPAPETPQPAPSSEKPREETTRDDWGTTDGASPWPESSDCDCAPPPPVPTPTDPSPSPSPSLPASASASAEPPAPAASGDGDPANHPSTVKPEFSGM